jgi:hypothetical protein
MVFEEKYLKKFTKTDSKDLQVKYEMLVNLF